ncbi:tryptophan synthase subunit alpha [Protaetiibacter larvae]|uniref:Tryptophan synthase subunit alpha n=1 Tax=Protaetiibacter larvae TaxID=2592654 RepID=A0A5C1Y872_9MICO|nr:tryptophan synthase subunit alpha [Protaetiibacter larvae]QEO10303.1 tryptophan synthase subunit alpha [Protaetiibacter larvae]
MTAHEETDGVRRRASLEVLRAEAADELSTVAWERLRSGEDPWEFMQELPSVDELVVLTLRAELIHADNDRRPNRDVDYRMLRQIALAYPPLSTAVWRLLDGEPTRRRTA